MTHLVVADLELGGDLDQEACKALRGGVGNADLGLENAGQNGNGLSMNQPGTGVFIGSPTIVNQFIFDMDTNLLIAPITELVSTVSNLTATNSILQDLDLPF
ncbi:MAG: hypothetical protein PVF57_17525 [Pseudomonadales bacterium]|jgi:hypothetical protein